MVDRAPGPTLSINRRAVLIALVAGAATAPGITVWAQARSDLRRFLIDLPGWTASPPSTFNSVAEMLIQREYTRDDTTLLATLEIGLLGPPTAFGALTTHAPDQVPQKDTIAGFAVERVHVESEDSGAIVVVLVDSEKRPAVFLLEYDGLSAETAMDTAREFDWPAMQQAVSSPR